MLGSDGGGTTTRTPLGGGIGGGGDGVLDLDDFADAFDDLSFLLENNDRDLRGVGSRSSCGGGTGGGGTSLSIGVGGLRGIVDFSEVFVSDFFFFPNLNRDLDDDDDELDGLSCCTGGCGGGGIVRDSFSGIGFSNSSLVSPFLSNVDDLSDGRLSGEADGGGSGASMCGVSGEDDGGRGAIECGVSGEADGGGGGGGRGAIICGVFGEADGGRGAIVCGASGEADDGSVGAIMSGGSGISSIRTI